jgi:hypothetical protein
MRAFLRSHLLDRAAASKATWSRKRKYALLGFAVVGTLGLLVGRALSNSVADRNNLLTALCYSGLFCFCAIQAIHLSNSALYAWLLEQDREARRKLFGAILLFGIVYGLVDNAVYFFPTAK